MDMSLCFLLACKNLCIELFREFSEACTPCRICHIAILSKVESSYSQVLERQVWFFNPWNMIRSHMSVHGLYKKVGSTCFLPTFRKSIHNQISGRASEFSIPIVCHCTKHPCMGHDFIACQLVGRR